MGIDSINKLKLNETVNKKNMDTTNDQTLNEKYQRIQLPTAYPFSEMRSALDVAFPDGIEGLDFPYTMFAPTDLAFEKVENDTIADLMEDRKALAEVLLRHIVSAGTFQIPVGFSRLMTVGGEILVFN